MMANSDSKSAIRKFVTYDYEFDAKRKPQIVLGACGSVAAMKFGLVLRTLSEWAEVKAVVTKTALHFLSNGEARSLIPEGAVIFCDEYDWKSWKKIGDSVLHIELAKWADIMVIAPLSAHTAAKVTYYIQFCKLLWFIDELKGFSTFLTH
jgi:phosphopantothenoylcysteine decarboxylase